jgi:hypothetical protein
MVNIHTVPACSLIELVPSPVTEGLHGVGSQADLEVLQILAEQTGSKHRNNFTPRALYRRSFTRAYVTPVSISDE